MGGSFAFLSEQQPRKRIFIVYEEYIRNHKFFIGYSRARCKWPVTIPTVEQYYRR